MFLIFCATLGRASYVRSAKIIFRWRRSERRRRSIVGKFLGRLDILPSFLTRRRSFFRSNERLSAAIRFGCVKQLNQSVQLTLTVAAQTNFAPAVYRDSLIKFVNCWSKSLDFVPRNDEGFLVHVVDVNVFGRDQKPSSPPPKRVSSRTKIMFSLAAS